MIKEALCKVMEGEIASHEISEAFDEIFSGLADEISASSFITALKSNCSEEEYMYEAIISARNAVKKINLGTDCEKIIENISFDLPKDIMDVSFACDIICAANGTGSASSCLPNLKKPSFEILKAFNCTIKDCSLEEKREIFEKTNFLYSYIDSESPYLKYTREIFHKLPFDNILGCLNSLLNVFGAKNCSIGISNEELCESRADICLKLNYSNSIIVAGANNIPYATPYGETIVAEAWKNKIFAYKMSPELLEFREYDPEEIKCENFSHNAQIIKEIFENKIKDAPYEAVVVNSALCLYITKCANSLLEGLELAKKTIADGYALEKLLEVIKIYS